MYLSDRDIAILNFLLEFRYCFQSQVKDVFFKDVTAQACSKVLCKLKNLKLIFLEYTPRTFHFNLGNLVFLTERGARLLAEERKVSSLHELGYRKVTCHPRSNSFIYHRKKIIDVHIQIKEELKTLPLDLKYMAREDQKVKRPFGEMVMTTLYSTDHQTKITPDLVMVIQSQVTANEAVYVIEIDTGSETIGRGKKHQRGQTILNKFQRYQKLLIDPSRGWKENLPKTSADGFQVLVITSSDQRIQTMKSLEDEIHAHDFFRFSSFKRLEEGSFFCGNTWTGFGKNDYETLV